MKKQRLGRFIACILAIMMVLVTVLIAGCSEQVSEGDVQDTSKASEVTQQESAPAADTAESTTEVTTLKVYTWWDVTKFEHLNAMKDEFEAQNPDVEIEFMTIPTDYADSMVVKLAGGEIPDVMMLAMDQIPRYAQNNMILSLGDYANQEYLDSLYPVVLDALTYEGELYAVARDITPKVMYLNTKMFEEASIEIPSEDWTIDDFVDVAQQLTKGSGVDAQWGYYWQNYPDPTYAFIAAFGGDFYSEDGLHSVLSTDENTMEALQFMYDLYNTYCVCPSAEQAALYGENAFSAFMADKVAMQIGGLSTQSTFDAAETKYTVLPMPSVNGISSTSSFVNSWVIPTSAENPELSWRVLEFFSGTEGQQIVMDMEFGLPASKDVDTSAFEAERPYNKYYVEALETAVPYPVNKNGSNYQNLFKQECEKLWAGIVKPEEFAATVDEEAESILSAAVY